METVTRRGFVEPGKIAAEEAAINVVQNQTDAALKAYADRPDTFSGRYVSADTFKELMPGFADSRQSRNELNGAVHNAAAVLASEQFRRLVAQGPQEDNRHVVFVTGIPGAGKSSSVAGAFGESAAIVYEGQLSRPEPGIEKIQQALDAGFNVGIVAVHVPPEVALQRTNNRFIDPNNGRGASISVMSDIQGNLPDGLRQIQQRFGDRIELQVFDNTPGQQSRHDGWQAIHVLEKEGNREHISHRLQAALEQGYRSGQYSAEFYKQAAGRQPEAQLAREASGQGDREQSADGNRSSLPARDPEPRSLSETGGQAPAEVVASSGLIGALAATTRETRLVGTTQDPVARDLIESQHLQALDQKLASLGIRDLKPIAAGTSSVVLDAGQDVVRVGMGDLTPRPIIPEVLQAQREGVIGGLRYEILPKVEVTGITEHDVSLMQSRIAERGYQWTDAGIDNLGRINGQLVVTDPGGLQRIEEKVLTPGNTLENPLQQSNLASKEQTAANSGASELNQTQTPDRDKGFELLR
ncbi:MAG: Uncharacterized protein FD131_3155 [Rhodocyclaceae bacterium]|nr:MAG: Uncharacterized protein FD131_3155 [Rhodocyclaceae bacterium]